MHLYSGYFVEYFEEKEHLWFSPEEVKFGSHSRFILR